MATKTIKAHATVSTAYGNDLEKPISFDYEFDQLGTNEEIPADEMPNPKAILSLVNQRRASAARAAKQNEVLEAAGVKKPTLEDPNVQLSTMVRALKASGKSEDEATQIAKTLLNMS